jgi:hypothetical protein
MSIEQELREMLRARSEYAPAPQPPAHVVRRARARTVRSVLSTAFVVVGALALAVAVASQVAPEERAYAALALDDRPSVKVGAPPDRHSGTEGQPITRPMLEKNLDCMRTRGFDLPDPVATPQGWQVIVESSEPLPSESPDLAVRERWARAVFVDCRLLDFTGDLVLGGRTRLQIDRLRTCARAEGFALPTPSESRPGEFVFDLDSASPRWSEAWYETVFVRCGLWRSDPEPG